jgi:hypothetical protein
MRFVWVCRFLTCWEAVAKGLKGYRPKRHSRQIAPFSLLRSQLPRERGSENKNLSELKASLAADSALGKADMWPNTGQVR